MKEMRRIAKISILISLMALAFMSSCIPGPWSLVGIPTYTPSMPNTSAPLYDLNQEAAFVAAQATLAYGQGEIANLSLQATLVSMDILQAANAAAQTTLDYNKRRLMELSIQGTEVSQNIARAAATQEFITAQTQMVWNSTSTAQSQAVTATYAAYVLNVTQTAQVQAIQDVQVAYAVQANATQAAYALTATPWAEKQSEIARIRDNSEQRSWWENSILTPLLIILSTFLVLLLILGGVIVFWRLVPVMALRLPTIAHVNNSPFLLEDGTILDSTFPDHDAQQQELNVPNLPHLLGDDIPNVEIVGPSEPSVTNWITEAEQQLRADGRPAL